MLFRQILKCDVEFIARRFLANASDAAVMELGVETQVLQVHLLLVLEGISKGRESAAEIRSQLKSLLLLLRIKLRSSNHLADGEVLSSTLGQLSAKVLEDEPCPADHGVNELDVVYGVRVLDRCLN